jgi:hypothetical protein
MGRVALLLRRRLQVTLQLEMARQKTAPERESLRRAYWRSEVSD